MLTGCRISALNNWRVDRIIGDHIYFHEGKSTRGLRKVQLPTGFLLELNEYRRRQQISGIKVFGINSETFVKHFRKYVRPLLGGRWLEKQHDFSYDEKLFVYQLKFLRKNYQTLLFKQELDRWRDAYVALEFTSKAMRHSKTGITSYHYLENFDDLGLQNKVPGSMSEAVKLGDKSLYDYFVE